MATRKRCAKRILAMVLTAAVTMSTVITDSNITAYATTEAEVESNSQDAENTVESAPVTDEQGGSEDTTDNSTPSESTEGTDNPSGTAEDSKTDQPDAGESKDTSSDTSTDGSTDTESSSTDAGEESKDETENKDTDSADAAEGEEKPEGEEVTEENPDALLNPEEEVTEEEIGEAEVYANYFFGDPAYNENYIYDYDENDDPIYEMYSQDLDEIIGMAEEGMSLEHFFNGTLFANMTLDALHEMQDDSYSFDDLVNAYSFGIGDVPNSIMKYVGDGASPISLYSERDGGGSLTSTGVRHLSAGALGQQSVLGKDKEHGPVVKLQASADGMTYDAFCATYGGSYRSGYTYTSVDWSELKTPGGASLTQEQYDVIQFLVAVFLKTTNQSDADYAGCQTAIWYVINNPNNIGNFYWDGIGVNGDGPMMPAIRAIASGNAAVQSGIISFIRTAHICYTLVSDITDFSPVGIDYYPGQAPELTFWKTDQSNFQWIITWDIGPLPVFVGAGIPIINNYYLEKEAVTRYNVDITKESVITNELLEGVQFRVDETDAGEHDINYTFKRGENTGAYDEDPVAEEYLNATINPDSFGQEVDESINVPYMDDDVKPSGGKHTTLLTTDENGHASTTFKHEHTFKEWYSQCLDGYNKPISYEAYQQRWQYALAQAQAEGLLTTAYMGQEVTMSYDQIKAIYDAQQIVYTQSRDEALQILNDCYNDYVSRKYKYVVTELTPYTREGGEDSNGKTMDTLELPKAGYRMNVQDTTTIGEYVEVISDGETMITGGRNDKDENTKDLNVTNEPWYNQIFINKTDLESGAQILYDTKFDIYEYYGYKVNLEAASEPIYPAKIVSQFRTDDGASVNPKTITAATLKVTNAAGDEVYSRDLDLDKLKEAMATGGDPESYVLNFQTAEAGTFQVKVDFTVDATLDDMFGQETVSGHLRNDGTTCTCGSTCDANNCPVCKVANKFCKLNGTSYTMYTVEGGIPKIETITDYTDTSSGSNISATFTTNKGRTYQYTLDGTTGISKFVSNDGKTYLSTDGARLEINVSPVPNVFTYTEPVDDVRLFTADGGNTYFAAGDKNYTTAAVNDEAGTIILNYMVGVILDSGSYDVTSEITVSENELNGRVIDTNVTTDPDDYTTWGQDNYEIVRVTADIAKQMGWSDTTIGMYTVHRVAPLDQYTGTTFGNTDDKKTGEMYGYKEYGTLYYTQANLGKFCIVETQAPADGERSGYLGNYEDREYTKLDDHSSQKNNEGAPYATNDQVSVTKIPHYLTLCTDTNQYGTYMLTDGYHEYTDQYHSNFVEYLHDPDTTATVDGYDADFYEQSALHKSITLEKFMTGDESNILHDILNAHWDQMFSSALTQKAGFIVDRHSDKTSTYFKLLEGQDPETILNFVGTTINMDSYRDNDPDASRILYRGAYTLTQIQYNTYTANAENLNSRHGFNNVDYLQVGDITYDNADEEKNARYFNTEKSVDKSDMNAFIDERTYAFIRFTKYDSEAERYVKGDVNEDYEAGTDHGDADLDGAIYSLYINETNTFDVDYLEGTLNGKLFWAQPLNTGGYRVIWDADDSDAGFTDTGSNTFEDYPHAYLLADGTFHLDYTDDTSASAAVTVKTQTLYGIQHPDGRYGGPKHNGWFAVLDEQQVFIDTDEDGYADTWTVQDVTLENGAKVASATIGEIADGELQFDGLYLGSYFIAEEIRTSLVISSMTTDDEEQKEVKWLSFAPGYYAETDTNGNPVKHFYSFKYEPKNIDGTNYNQEQVYVQKDTVQYSNQLVEKGSFQLRKVTTNESDEATGTTQKPLEGAGFTVYLISDLSMIQDGTIQPAFSLHEGDLLVHNGNLAPMYDESENFVGYKFTLDYINENHPFEAKYGTDYNLDEVNRIVYVAGHGYYFIRDILDAYKNAYYSDVDKKWDFSNEEQAIARMYENNPDTIAEVNKGYEKKDNTISSGAPEEYYGVNGISDGWVATGNTIKNKNEYRLSEIFTNYNGFLRSPDIPWGAYIVVETTTPKNVFTVDPYFVTISDSSSSILRARTVTLKDNPLVASLVLVKRDAQSGQDVLQAGTSYRIWDYTNNKYVEKYILGDNGALSAISQTIFHTTEDGRINAVANLEVGRYRLEELSGPRGYHNTYWDYGDETVGEKLGGVGTDKDVATLENMFKSYYGTVEFDVTTERKYKSSGITSSGNLDYIYIGENYFNDEVLGKLNILKTGEVLVGYTNTDNIEYSDEYTDAADPNYNKLKSSAKDRSVFNKVKEHYDLGTDEITYRDVTEEIKVDETTAVEKLIVDADGENLAAVYTDGGKLVTMSGGVVSEAPGYDYKDNVKTRTFYPYATLKEMPVVNDTVENGTVTKEPVVDSSVRGEKTLLYKVTTTITDPLDPALVTTEITYEYADGSAATVADETALKPAYELTTEDSKKIYDEQSTFTEIANAVMVTYENTMRSYYNAELKDVADMYILAVSGDVINTDYLVTKNADGTYTTTDGGTVTMGSANKATISYTEAIYDPDTNYKYVLTFADGSTLNVKLVTYGVFLTAENGDLVKALKTGGFEITTPSGKTTSYPDATISLAEDATGETYDFVYEERPLAGATYQITAAEDIYTQDGGGGLWFKKGDVVATVTTGNDGEIVSFSPNYKTADNAGSGSYDYTYYYGNTEGNYTSLTGKKTYASDEFATTGGIKNHWTDTEMTSLEKEIFGSQACQDATIYPNTFYKEDTIELYRTLYRSGKKGNLVDTGYVTRLENEGNITTHSAGVVTELNDNGNKGYRITWTNTQNLTGVSISQDNELYTIKKADGSTIEAKVNDKLFTVAEDIGIWHAGDMVEKTAKGYKFTHTDPSETAVSKGATTIGAMDLGFTTIKYYPNAALKDNGDGTYDLMDGSAKIATLKGDILETEFGGIVTRNGSSVSIYYEKTEDLESELIQPTMTITGGTLVVGQETYDLIWDEVAKHFTTALGNTVDIADDRSFVTITVNGTPTKYTAFKLTYEYDLHWASDENVVTVENDGTLGEVSVYLPLGKYNVQEVATPYGFLINNQVQTVELKNADQVKEVVFNTEQSSTNWTDQSMNIWTSKGLTWFLGGENTVGEHQVDMKDNEFFTWGTRGDAENAYYTDQQSLLTFYDLRVKAWSDKDVPKKPDDVGVEISKKSLTGGEEIPGAKLIIKNSKGETVKEITTTGTPTKITDLPDDVYTLTEVTAPNGYEKAESITFVIADGKCTSGTVVMFDAPDTDEEGFYFSKKDFTNKEELPGAHIIVTDDSTGEKVLDFISSKEPTRFVLPDGDYTFTEITAPDGYDKAESIKVTVKDGKVDGGYVLMYDGQNGENKPEGDRREESEENQWKLGVGIYKADKETNASLAGGKFGLYTRDNIYNVDGKLLVKKDSLLATATTDYTGHANFDVDIALLSKYLDPNASDADLIFNKTVTYNYTSLEKGETKDGYTEYTMITYGCGDVTLRKYVDGTWKLETGETAIVNEAAKTMKYTVNNSIDGNTAVNTGKYYIKELTPPDGYLYDETVYDVKFEYDDDKTMYIPVYAEHVNRPTEVTIDKKDLTGSDEVPGATISVYKVKNALELDDDGRISHEDSNLLKLGSYVSDGTNQSITGLLLSNKEWPRLNNQMVRNNIYVFREEIPGDGYATTTDIEFKLYQEPDENGDFWNANDVKVLVNNPTCDQEYVEGTLVAPLENADEDSNWDYTKTLDSVTVAKWRLVNKVLIVSYNENATQNTIDKVLKASDFKNYDIDKVYFEGNDTIHAKGFFEGKVVTSKPEEAKLTFTNYWTTLDDIHMTMHDDTTKVLIRKQDLATGENVVGAHLKLTDLTAGELVEEWISTEEDYYFENRLIVGHKYMLEETLAPTEDGYVKSNSITFVVEDTGAVQKVVMEDDFTKLEISKADFTTSEELDGARIEIWKTDENGNRTELVESYISGQDGYNEDGTVKKHYIDYLAPGTYTMVEITAPNGYLVADDVNFTITETGLLQKVQMLDDTTVLKIYKYRTGTTEFVPGAKINVYQVPEKYVKYLTNGVKVSVTGGVVDPATDSDFTVNTDTKSSSDLAAYLTGVAAKTTEHRSTYTTTLTLDYSILKADMQTNGPAFTQILPDSVKIADDQLGQKHDVVLDEATGEKAFTYEFGKNASGASTITVTFDSAYAAAPTYSVYNIDITLPVTISANALRGTGDLRVTFADGVVLNIAKDDIVEVDSSVDTPVVNIELSDADLKATVVTEEQASVIHGLREGWYVAMETEAPKGYVLDKTPQLFHIETVSGEQALYFYNKLKKSGGGHSHHDSPTPETPTPAPTPTPEIGILTLTINGGWWWNNVRTEDNGQSGYSIKVTVNDNSATPLAAATRSMATVAVGFVLIALSAGGFIIMKRRKREEES